MVISPKGGGDIEGRIPAKQREWHGATPRSTMTQQNKKTPPNYATLSNLAYIEHIPKKIYNQNTRKPRGGYVIS